MIFFVLNLLLNLVVQTNNHFPHYLLLNTPYRLILKPFYGSSVGEREREREREYVEREKIVQLGEK